METVITQNKFQFQTGAIKRLTKLAKTFRFASFNSKLVRLKALLPFGPIHRLMSFNSKLVRLKARHWSGIAAII